MALQKRQQGGEATCQPAQYECSHLSGSNVSSQAQSPSTSEHHGLGSYSPNSEASGLPCEHEK